MHDGHDITELRHDRHYELVLYSTWIETVCRTCDCSLGGRTEYHRPVRQQCVLCGADDYTGGLCTHHHNETVREDDQLDPLPTRGVQFA